VATSTTTSTVTLSVSGHRQLGPVEQGPTTTTDGFNAVDFPAWSTKRGSKPVLTSDGQTIRYFSTDTAGNAEDKHISATGPPSDRSTPTTTDNNVPSGPGHVEYHGHVDGERQPAAPGVDKDLLHHRRLDADKPRASPITRSSKAGSLPADGQKDHLLLHRQGRPTPRRPPLRDGTTSRPTSRPPRPRTNVDAKLACLTSGRHPGRGPTTPAARASKTTSFKVYGRPDGAQQGRTAAGQGLRLDEQADMLNNGQAIAYYSADKRGAIKRPSRTPLPPRWTRFTGVQQRREHTRSGRLPTGGLRRFKRHGELLCKGRTGHGNVHRRRGERPSTSYNGSRNCATGPHESRLGQLG